MLFHITFQPKAGFTPDDQRLTLKLWQEWTPPKGYEIKSFYIGADGRGFLISEGTDAAAIYEALSPWAGVLVDYEIVPVVEVDRAVEIMKGALDKR